MSFETYPHICLANANPLDYCVKMVWMETFCFYCSVRLGVIVSAILSMAIIVLTFLLIHGPYQFQAVKRLIEQQHPQDQDNSILKLFNVFSEHLSSYLLLFNGIVALHILACISAVYGSLRLKKAFLIPFMVIQFVIFATATMQHIVLMVIMKKIVNLGFLIGITIAGAFYLLFIGYGWSASVAMYQIIILVKSQRYKALYGDDPMAPRRRNDILLGHGTIENVNIFLMPNDNDVSAIKRKRLIEEQQRHRFGREIISVVPVDQAEKRDETDEYHFDYWHWNELVGVRRVIR